MNDFIWSTVIQKVPRTFPTASIQWSTWILWHLCKHCQMAPYGHSRPQGFELERLVANAAYTRLLDSSQWRWHRWGIFARIYNAGWPLCLDESPLLVAVIGIRKQSCGWDKQTYWRLSMMPNFDIGRPRAACAADNKTIISIGMALESRGKPSEIRERCEWTATTWTRVSTEQRDMCLGVGKTKKYECLLLPWSKHLMMASVRWSKT